MNSTKGSIGLLLASLSITPPTDFRQQSLACSPDGWAQVVALAVKQHVAPLLYHRLKTHGCEALLPAETWLQLQKSWRANQLRNMQIYHALGVLINALQAEKIPCLVLKGAHLAATVYESIALRTMADLDILVPQAQLTAAVTVIETLGYQPEIAWRSLAAFLDRGHHLPPFLHLQRVGSVELHWRITRPNHPYTIAMDELWLRSRPITIAGIATHGFCPEDLLLHVCMHATHHHQLQQGIRPLCDIAELLRCHAETLDWEAIIARAIRWQWQRGVFLALTAARQLIGAPVPDEVLSRLNPASSPTFDADELPSLLFSEHLATSHYFLRFLTSPNLIAKARLLCDRLFLTRQEMALAYPMAVDSPLFYFYYAVRLKELLGRYRYQAWRTPQDQAPMVAQQTRLHQWLEQPEVN